MSAHIKTVSEIKHDLSIGVTLPSCPSAIVPFILQNHQLYIAKYLNEVKPTPNNSLLLWHGLGSGKTITSIAGAYETTDGRDIIVACPASLMDNYQEELTGEYTNKVIKYIGMPYIGLAIDIANKFIAECNKNSVNDVWVKPFIENLIDKIGASGDITKFSDADIARIVASKDKTIFDASLKGGTRREKKRKNKTKKRGGFNIDMTVHGVHFIFKTTNGVLNTHGFGDLSGVSLIIIDESQLLISQLSQDYSDIDLSRNPIKPDAPLNFRKPFIDMTEFTDHVTTSKGITNVRAHRLYNELMRRPLTTQLVLLSATPIIKNKYEIAIAVNILAREELMPVNKSVFEKNYGSITRPRPYVYTKTNAERIADINANISLSINNEATFRRLCKGRVSVFGNIQEMLPTLNLLPDPVKHIFNNDGKPFISIKECKLRTKEMVHMKYLQFVCDDLGHSQFGTLKPQFVDCAFRLDNPDVHVPTAPHKHTKDGFLTKRGDAVENSTVRFLHSFQTFLVEENIEVTAKKAYGAEVKLPKTATLTASESLTPSIKLNELMNNSKIFELLFLLKQTPTKRHVIYVTSRYVAVVIGRLLTMYNACLEISKPDEILSSASGVPFPGKENYFAFLRGQSEDDNDPVTMFKYAEDEGNAENKASLIKLFNDEKNDSKFKILIINNCVAEGITLKRVDYIHVFSLPYDIAKLQQIVARVYRNCVHPPGGSVTPILYLTVGDDRALTPADYATVHPGNAQWQRYANTVPLVPNYEINALVAKINENDELLPYYRILKECSIEV